MSDKDTIKDTLLCPEIMGHEQTTKDNIKETTG